MKRVGSHAGILAYGPKSPTPPSKPLLETTLEGRKAMNREGRRRGASGPGSSPGRGHLAVFLGKTLYSHSASLHPRV